MSRSSTDNFLRLRRLLDRGHEPSVQELCERLDLSERQIRRLVGQLRDEGVPIRERRSGRRKRFYLPEEHRCVYTEHFEFEEEEVLALAAASEAAKATFRDTPMGTPLDRAFEKLLDRLAPRILTFEVEEQPSRWHFDAHASARFDPRVFRLLQQSINEGRSVRIDYFAASTGERTTGRKIEPHQLARYSSTWSVVAWCHLRRDFRDFALAGIESLELCDPEKEVAYFPRRDDFDPEAYFRDRFSALSGDAPRIVRLLVEADKAEYFRRKRYHASQLVEPAPEGRVIVTYRVKGLEEIRSFAQSWGVGVTVIDPPELVERMREEVDELAKRYARRGEYDDDGAP